MWPKLNPRQPNDKESNLGNNLHKTDIILLSEKSCFSLTWENVSQDMEAPYS